MVKFAFVFISLLATQIACDPGADVEKVDGRTAAGNDSGAEKNSDANSESEKENQKNQPEEKAGEEPSEPETKPPEKKTENSKPKIITIDDVDACLAKHKPKQPVPDTDGYGCTLSITPEVGIMGTPFTTTMAVVGDPDAAALDGQILIGKSGTSSGYLGLTGGSLGQVFKIGGSKHCLAISKYVPECDPLACKLKILSKEIELGNTIDIEIEITGKPKRIFIDQKELGINDRVATVPVENALGHNVSAGIYRYYWGSVVGENDLVSTCQVTADHVKPPAEALKLTRSFDTNYLNSFSVYNKVYADQDLHLMDSSNNVLKTFNNITLKDDRPFYTIFRSNYTNPGDAFKICLAGDHSVCSAEEKAIASSVELHDLFMRGENLHIVYSAYTDGTSYFLYSGTQAVTTYGISQVGRYLHVAIQKYHLSAGAKVGAKLRLCHNNVEGKFVCASGAASNEVTVRQGPQDSQFSGAFKFF